MTISFEPIGIIHSCFKEKFGIPRQAGLVPDAPATLELLPPYNREEALNGLADFSHIWVVFVFHEIRRNGWRATVRPPRLGGNKRVGVFATRSGFRPNPMGLSAVALEKISRESGKMLLHLRGGDFLDGTPVLDIKPYVPYADNLPAATGGFAAHAPEPVRSVVFSDSALADCVRVETTIPHLRRLITQVLQCDPRPAYYDEKPKKTTFGTRLYDFDVKWEYRANTITVTHIVPCVDPDPADT